MKSTPKKPSTRAAEAYFTDIELASRLKVSRQTIWRWVSRGVLPEPLKLGPRTSRWRACDIRNFERSLNQ